eukprot:TRINITY_DN227_c0_g1_i13.p1 TRINITY_DN227_c0_g1~~TRINITY_DN227_c0_g1_i13.p1  ORF type:complete len:103 (+),score=26.20 TRINITY_DN227_c0_g1_i13:2-310(+)
MKQYAGDYEKYMKQGGSQASSKQGADYQQYMKQYASDYMKYANQGDSKAFNQQGGDYEKYMKQYAGDYMKYAKQGGSKGSSIREVYEAVCWRLHEVCEARWQ